MSAAWEKGSTTRWRKLRAAVLAANETEHAGRCQAGLPGICTGKADQVHHTKGRKVTGDDPRYLLPICGPCNRAIGEPGRSNPPPSPRSRW